MRKAHAPVTLEDASGSTDVATNCTHTDKGFQASLSRAVARDRSTAISFSGILANSCTVLPTALPDKASPTVTQPAETPSEIPGAVSSIFKMSDGG
jgi:hypothetical protein